MTAPALALVLGLCAAAPLAVPAAPFPLTESSDADTPSDSDKNNISESVYGRVLEFRRQQLQVRPVISQLWSAPMPVPTDIQRPRAMDSWAPEPGDAGDWGIVRGNVEVLDDLDLADLLGDTALRGAIENKRFWPHLAWTSTFSTLGAGAVGTGVWLTWFTGRKDADARDVVAVGTSLLIAGVTSMALAWLYPEMTPAHVLSPMEAQVRCDAYNQQLRHALDLSPTDLSRFSLLRAAAFDK